MKNFTKYLNGGIKVCDFVLWWILLSDIRRNIAQNRTDLRLTMFLRKLDKYTAKKLEAVRRQSVASDDHAIPFWGYFIFFAVCLVSICHVSYN